MTGLCLHDKKQPLWPWGIWEHPVVVFLLGPAHETGIGNVDFRLPTLPPFSARQIDTVVFSITISPEENPDVSHP